MSTAAIVNDSPTKKVILIAAVFPTGESDPERKFGIGKNNKLLSRLPLDMAHFKSTTMEAKEGKINAVVMGRKTFESVPKKFRLLEGRKTVVVGSNLEDINKLLDEWIKANSEAINNGDQKFSSSRNSFLPCTSFDETISILKSDPLIDKIFIAGGEKIYEEGNKIADALNITQVIQDGDRVWEADRFFTVPLPTFTYEEMSKIGITSEEAVGDKAPIRHFNYTVNVFNGGPRGPREEKDTDDADDENEGEAVQLV